MQHTSRISSKSIATVGYVRHITAPTSRFGFPFNIPTGADQQEHPVEEVFAAGMRHHHVANTAYPIGHSTTMMDYRVPRITDQKALRETMLGGFGYLSEMGLYVHIPFCAQRCQFCEYTVVDPKNAKEDANQEAYFRALLGEMSMYKELLGTSQKKLIGFDIGGGTPSYAHARDIGRVMDAVRDSFILSDSCAVSIETTPRIAASDPDKLKAYKAMGIDRISMGVQTTDFSEAKSLGRDDANGDYIFRAVDNIREAGFDNFNIDVMYGFPQRRGRPDTFPATLRQVMGLGPEHVTLYRMRYKGTKMAFLMDRVTLDQINDQETVARDLLEEAGYEAWMGKNTYSRDPQSSGCSDYLERRVTAGVPYLGLGLGAQSFSRHTLSYNLGAVTKKMGQYLRSVELGRLPLQDLYHLSLPQAMAKMVAVSFYFGGVDRACFADCFGWQIEEAFPREVGFLLGHGLMEYAGHGAGRLALTTLGKKHYGGVIAQFYAPSVKQHLMHERPGGELGLDNHDSYLSPKTPASTATASTTAPTAAVTSKDKAAEDEHQAATTSPSAAATLAAATVLAQPRPTTMQQTTGLRRLSSVSRFVGPAPQHRQMHTATATAAAPTPTVTSLDTANAGSTEATERVPLTFLDSTGIRTTVHAQVGHSVLDVARDAGVDLECACNGELACSTCHVVVTDPLIYQCLPEATEEELDMLDLAYKLTDTSRLGCQVRVTSQLAGLCLEIPPTGI